MYLHLALLYFHLARWYFSGRPTVRASEHYALPRHLSAISSLRTAVPLTCPLLEYPWCGSQAMVALVLADVLMQQKAQCELFPADALETLETNPLGKKLSGAGVSAASVHTP